jgi:hypothetical protein
MGNFVKDVHKNNIPYLLFPHVLFIIDILDYIFSFLP